MCGELGLVTVVKDVFSGQDGYLDALRQEARQLGGDALVGLRDFYKAEGDSGSWGLSATVVRFTEPGCRS